MTVAVQLAIFAPCYPVEALPTEFSVFGRVRENSASREYASKCEDARRRLLYFLSGLFCEYV
jgi:hypothetical protein